VPGKTEAPPRLSALRYRSLAPIREQEGKSKRYATARSAPQNKRPAELCLCDGL